MILILVSLFCAVVTSAAPVRVTTWNLEPSSAVGTNGASRKYQDELVREAAEVLKKLNPDVIVLQEVQDWQSCSDLVKALKPAKYTVATWSSFRDPHTGMLNHQQVAILSKTKAYISWSEAWKDEGATSSLGGFAFAAIRIGGKNAGFYSAQFSDDALATDDNRSETHQRQREESARQMLQQIASLQNWTTNKVQSVVLGGDFNTSLDDPALTREKTLSQLEQAGLANILSSLPKEKRITVATNGQQPGMTTEYVFTWGAAMATAPGIVTASLTEHYPVTCELDFATPPAMPISMPLAETKAPVVAAPKPAVVEAVPVKAVAAVPVPAPITPAVAVATPVSEAKKNWQRNAEFAAGGILLLVVVWKLARRNRPPPMSAVLLAMQTSTGANRSSASNPERIVIAPQANQTAGSAADYPPIVHIETHNSAEVQLWRRRAEEAERRAEKATATIKKGLIPHLSEWLKSKMVQRLASDRAQLIEIQQMAAMKMMAVDERLAKVEKQLEERYRVYERRIDELETELAEAKEENRELIRAKIALVKAEMEKERTAARAKA